MREKGVIKKENLYKQRGVVIERLLPHPAFSHLLPNGEGNIKITCNKIKLNQCKSKSKMWKVIQ